MDGDSIGAIIQQYAKHGWKLRRVLLSHSGRNSLSRVLKDIFGDADIIENPHEALWFSRRSQPDREAWELRRLSATAYALVTSLDDEMSESERETTLKETEIQMFETPHNEPLSH